MSIVIIINMVFMLMFGMNQDELIYLTKAVEAEAGICDYIEKMAVADVILNRVDSENFPNTVTEVIQQQGQFQVYSNNRISTVKVKDITVKCVLSVLWCGHGRFGLYFCNYEISDEDNQKWFDTLTLIYEGRYMNYYE